MALYRDFRGSMAQGPKEVVLYTKDALGFESFTLKPL